MKANASDHGRAHAKAKILKNAMYQAGKLGLSINAHAVLAHVLAESWLVRGHWTANLAYTLLADRLGCSVQTIRRAAEQLHASGIVHVDRGRKRRVTAWTLNVGYHRWEEEVSPVTGGGITRDTSEVSPVIPSTTTTCNSVTSEQVDAFVAERSRRGRATAERLKPRDRRPDEQVETEALPISS